MFDLKPRNAGQTYESQSPMAITMGHLPCPACCSGFDSLLRDELRTIAAG